MVSDIFRQSEQSKQRQRRTNALELAIVTRVRSDANYQVKCRILSSSDLENEDNVATVSVQYKNDVELPREGDLVVLATNVAERPVILGTVYARGEGVPVYDKDERVLRHRNSGAKVHFEKDGQILIESENGETVRLANDGTVRVNGGTKPVVTDVSGSGVSSVEYSDDLRVP